MGKRFVAHNGFAFGMALLSGLLFALSMPGTGWGRLAWFAFVPLMLAAEGRSGGIYYWLFNVTGIGASVIIHSWFPDVLGPGLGYFLMVATGFLYGAFLQLGHVLQERMRRAGGWAAAVSLLAMPIVWTALEWARFVLPVTRDWWIEVLAKSQWLYSAPLQLLAVTGFTGLSFVIMLANSAIAAFLLQLCERRGKAMSAAIAAMLVPVVVVAWGAWSIPDRAAGTAVTAAAAVDMVNQDEDVQRLGGGTTAGDGYIADTPAMSAAIFELNAELTRQAFDSERPAFVVWGENEFADYSDETNINKLKELAASLETYIVADITWKSADGMHDTALLIGPDGQEVGKTAKINLTGGELDYGFVPGTVRGQVFETAYGRVGLAVCWDRHTTTVIRDLAGSGAGLVLVPVDDDFEGNAVFPRYGASDSVFRAVENRVGLVVGSTSGMSQIISPYGEMTASSSINERQIITGTTVVREGGTTLYTRWGDWFAYIAAIAFAALLIRFMFLRRRA